MKPKGKAEPKAGRTAAIPKGKVKPKAGPTAAALKPKGKTGWKAGRAAAIWRKTAALPPRVWAAAGVVAVVAAILWFMLLPARKETPPQPLPGAPATGGNLTPRPPAPAVSPGARVPEKDLAFIKDVRLQPPQPTRMDTLKAEVVPAPNAPEELVYTYLWRVNDRIVEEAKRDTLELSTFRKRDLVTVTVTPYEGDTAGFAVQSPIIAIRSIPPTLDLKAQRQARKPGATVELQLTGAAPDGVRVDFSLADPRVSGMTIERQSGKITWVIQPDQKGVVRFGAAVEDDNGTKVTKVFDVTVE